MLDSTLNHGAHSKFVSRWLSHMKISEAVLADDATETDVLELSPEDASVDLSAAEDQSPEPISIEIPRVSEHPPQL